MISTPSPQIACQQILQEDNSVFSIQWVDLPPEISSQLTAERLLTHYLEAVRTLTAGLVQPVSSEQELAFCLAGRLPLLTFLPAEPVVTPEGSGLALRICGGLLVQPAQCERGELLLLLSQLPEKGQRITLRLADYCPLLLGSSQPSWIRRWLYRLTQAAIHRLVTVRFLVRLYRSLGGTGTIIRTVQVNVRNGRRT